MSKTSADDENCELCDGRGEIEATTKRAERDVVGCPLCIQRDKDEVIERLRKVSAGALVENMRTRGPSWDATAHDVAQLAAEIEGKPL